MTHNITLDKIKFIKNVIQDIYIVIGIIKNVQKYIRMFRSYYEEKLSHVLYSDY